MGKTLTYLMLFNLMTKLPSTSVNLRLNPKSSSRKCCDPSLDDRWNPDLDRCFVIGKYKWGLLGKTTTKPQVRDFSNRLVGKIFEVSFFSYSKCNFHNSVCSLLL